MPGGAGAVAVKAGSVGVAARAAGSDVPSAFRKEVWGGDFREGKTSNVELDAVYQRYLPESAIVPSDTMVRLNGQRVKTLVEMVRRQGTVFFPIFVMKHWIAGVLTQQAGGHVVLTTYDSAPSPVVEEQLCSVFRSVWPGLRLAKGVCPRQERNSNDCGIFMTAVFFGHHLKLRAVMRRDLPARLRRLLAATRQCPPPKEYFLEKIRKVLVNHPVSHKDFFYEEILKQSWRKDGAVVRGGAGQKRKDAGKGGRDAGKRDDDAKREREAAAKRRKRNEAAAAKRKAAKVTAAAAKKNAPKPPTPRRRPDPTNPPLQQRSRGRKAALKNDDDDAAEVTLAEQWAASRATENSATAAPASAQATAPTTTTAPQSSATVATRTRTSRRDNAEALGRPVAGWAEQTLAEARRHMRRVYVSVVDHLWAATALAMCGDGVSRGLGEVAVGMQRVRHKLPELQPYSVQEMLRLLEKRVHVVDGVPPADEETLADVAGMRRLVFRAEDGTETATLDPFIDEYYLVRGPLLERLPESVGGYMFVLGACLREAPEDMDGVRFPSYYALTRVAAEAAVGVYVPAAMTHYSASKPQRVSRNVTRYVPLPRSQQPAPGHDDNEEPSSAPLRRRDRLPDDDADFAVGDGDTTAAVVDAEDAVGDVPGNRRGDGYADMDAHVSEEATRALADIRALPLNVQGRPLTGPEEAEVCPRNWFLFASKPPHISQLAWNCVRPDTRSHHLRWLTRIKCMPTASLQMSLPVACIDLILSTARARRWKWATTAKAFAGVAGALRDLPLYSTQRRGIRLQDDPEWRSAFATVQRYMKESVPDAPPFVTLAQVRAVLATLRCAHPRAALFLAMMWGFAARAGDIATLRCKDVTVFQDMGPPLSEQRNVGTASVLLADGTADTVRVSLTVRMGKGAKKRGPYPIPSVLTRELAGTLQQMLVQRRPGECLFAPYTEELRTVVASALAKQKAGAQLPSVRKGALRCMADAGVPIKDLMTLSGHAKQATLLRYLGYGQQPTVDAETARANASRALFPTP